MVEIKANIEENGLGGWLIRVSDTFEDTNVFCKSIDEFAEVIEDIGAKYEGQIQVLWSKEDNVTQDHFMQIQAQMAKHKEQLDKQEK
jgi:hypothetical protein